MPEQPYAVAFFRDLNLGQGTSPTRAVLIEAFEAAGVDDALSFQVNGTVAYAAAVLGKRLGVPVTSRGVGTLLRLLARLDRPD